MNAECLVCIERGACRLRIFRYEFKITQGGDHSDDESHEKGQPDHPANLFCYLSSERIYSGSEDITDDEQE